MPYLLSAVSWLFGLKVIQNDSEPYLTNISVPLHILSLDIYFLGLVENNWSTFLTGLFTKPSIYKDYFFMMQNITASM